MSIAFPFVSIAGAPFERGCQYGSAVPERIARSASFYRAELARVGATGDLQAQLIAEFSAQIQGFRPDHFEEMRGIAQGAGVGIEEIVLINARTEIVAKARKLMRAAVLDPGEGECTAAIVMPQRSANGRMIHAHNWDWDPDARETSVVLRVTHDDGLVLMTIVEAGGLARYGMNSAGVALTGNYISCDRDYSQSGVPLSSIRRAALEQQHVAVAMQILVATPKACSSNMIISQDGWVIDLECAPDESFSILPHNGLLTHSNHFMSEVALGKIRDTGTTTALDTYYRAWRVRELLEACGTQITVAQVAKVLADDWATPYSVCRPPRDTLTGGRSATVATILIDTAELTMDIAALPSFGQSFTRYSITDDPQPMP